MFMSIKQTSNRAAWSGLLSLLVAVGLPWAGQGQNLPWPGGNATQPEFTVTRPAGQPTPPLAPRLQQEVIDPFNTTRNEAPTAAPLAGQNSTTILPEVELALAQFRQALGQAVTQAMQPDHSDTRLGQQLSSLVIESLVASPSPYVQLQGQRLRVGDSFVVQLPFPDRRAELQQQIEALKPNNVAADIRAQYDRLGDDALANYNTRLAEKLTAQERERVTVKVIQIAHRRVMLRAQGKDFTLKLQNAL